MKLDVCAAVEQDIALGLNLAGITDIKVWEEDGDPEKELKEWYRNKIEEGVGVMILSRSSGEILNHELFEKRAQGVMLPVVVMIPEEGEDKRARDLIKRAVGMDPSKKGKDGVSPVGEEVQREV